MDENDRYVEQARDHLTRFVRLHGSIRCSVCGDPLSGKIHVCSACGVPHHPECWDHGPGCTTRRCREAAGAPAPIVIDFRPHEALHARGWVADRAPQIAFMAGIALIVWLCSHLVFTGHSLGPVRPARSSPAHARSSPGGR
ncbi:MAG: hypothetical protein HY815_01700 [Candidatus Riflebacteria bacterium]|nr:hypothetical protein [Candidatus Riflebacteria bacterium]